MTLWLIGAVVIALVLLIGLYLLSEIRSNPTHHCPQCGVEWNRFGVRTRLRQTYDVSDWDYCPECRAARLADARENERRRGIK